MLRLIFALSILLFCLSLAACSASKGPLYAEGDIAGEIIRANMDSEIAKYTLAVSDDEPVVSKMHRLKLMQHIDGVPDASELEYLVKHGSTDFASVIYARALLQQPSNQRWQKDSFKLSGQLNANGVKKRLRQVFEKHHALLIPGWHWKTRTDTGADLSFQRKVLASYGLQSTLVETDEHGSVESNGELIVSAIKKAEALNKSVILISVSKGGADTAFALGGILDSSQASHLKGWLNIGGIIAGSTLVDNEMNQPKPWLKSIGFAPETPLNAMLDLVTEKSSVRLSKLTFSKQITIVNYVALPFGSDLSEYSKYSYNSLAKYGPNDGAALTHEMLVPGRQTVLEIGLDHYMRSLRAMRRAVALLFMIMECKPNSVCE